MSKKLFARGLFIISISLLTFSGCTYNSEEDLYPEVPVEENVSYISDIVPIIETNCIVCHMTGNGISGIDLEEYDDLILKVEDGSFLGSIRREEGWSAMPQSASKLPDNQINMISMWIDQGYPNN